MKHQEHILAIYADAVKTTSDELQMVEVNIEPGDVMLGQRKKLELSPQFRQVITYAVLQCGDKIAVYSRTASGGESRLHGKVSCGFGGHVDLADIEFDKESSVIYFDTTVKKAAIREINEEVEINRSLSLSDIEILPEKIVSSESDVDAVHIGLVTIIHLDSENISSKEDQLNILGFKTPSEILEYPEIENWTRGLCEFLKK